MTDDPNRPKAGEAIGALVESAMRLSASVAQTVAEAATGKPQGSKPGDTHLQTIIRHGTTAAGSIIATVVSAAQAPTDKVPDTAPRPGPQVSAGSALRVPLSIDNPSKSPMEGITPTLQDLTCTDAKVTFSPPTFSVGPQDFEKLVVTIEVPEDSPPGPYQMSFTLAGQNASPVVIAFAVV